MSVLDNIMVGRHHLLKNNFITGPLYWLTGARREELAHRRKVEEIIDFLDLQSVRKATAGTLAYGLRKRVELARALALEPKLLLLDEPMAGMNARRRRTWRATSSECNEECGMTIVMIETDMGVVMDISHRVIVLDFGRKIAGGDAGGGAQRVPTCSAPTSAKRPRSVPTRLPWYRRSERGTAPRRHGMMDYAGRVEQDDTLPKLLRRNAARFGDRTALREKDLGHRGKVFTWSTT